MRPVSPLNAFTVDTEEWFHVCGVPELAPDLWDRLASRIGVTTRLLLDDMAEAGIQGTFFVVGWIAERHPQVVRNILEAGHEVGSHGYLHRRVYELAPPEFRDDLARSVRALNDAGATDVRSFRAPEWSITEQCRWALDELCAAGIRIDASMAPVRIVGDVGAPRAPHIRPTSRGPILEVPPLVADRFGHVMPLGWGWGLRMSTPRRVLRAMEAVNASGTPAVVMVHPWEIDPDPPVVKLPQRLRFAHYFRLSGFRQRLKEIMREARFGTISDAAARYGPPAD